MYHDSHAQCRLQKDYKKIQVAKKGNLFYSPNLSFTSPPFTDGKPEVAKHNDFALARILKAKFKLSGHQKENHIFAGKLLRPLMKFFRERVQVSDK